MADKWILTRLNNVVGQVTDLLEKYELGMAAGALYDFVWSEFCDWYIEFTKPVLYGTDEIARRDAISVLCFVLDAILKLLHPFAPCITEQIYRSTPNCGPSIMVQPFPKTSDVPCFDNEAELVEELKELVTKIRNIRNLYNVAPSKRIRLYVQASDERIRSCDVYLSKLCNLEEVLFAAPSPAEKTVKAVGTAATCEVPLGDLVDFEKETERLTKELDNVLGEIARAEGKLNNAGFVAKAPAQLVENERAKLAKLRDLEQQLRSRLAELK